MSSKPKSANSLVPLSGVVVPWDDHIAIVVAIVTAPTLITMYLSPSLLKNHHFNLKALSNPPERRAFQPITDHPFTKSPRPPGCGV